MSFYNANLRETCANGLREMEENSKVFQDKNKMKQVITIDSENINVQGLMGQGAFASVKAATIDTGGKPLIRQKSSFSRRLFGTRNSFMNLGCKKYAIKSLRESLRGAMAFEAASDLAKEAMFLGTMRHPNIIYLHGAAQCPGKNFLNEVRPPYILTPKSLCTNNLLFKLCRSRLLFGD